MGRNCRYGAWATSETDWGLGPKVAVEEGLGET